MSFSYCVQCSGVTERDNALAFLQQIDWESLAKEHPDWHGVEMVPGNRLVYAPSIQRKFLLGFNAPQENNLALTASVWLACRVHGLEQGMPARIFKDDRPLDIAVNGKRTGREPHSLDADAQGVLTFSHESILERGMSFLEHKRLREVFEELSRAWPMGERAPHPRHARRRLGPSG